MDTESSEITCELSKALGMRDDKPRKVVTAAQQRDIDNAKAMLLGIRLHFQHSGNK